MHPGHVALTSYLKQNFLALKKKGLKSKHKLSNSLTHTKKGKFYVCIRRAESGKEDGNETKPAEYLIAGNGKAMQQHPGSIALPHYRSPKSIT